MPENNDTKFLKLKGYKYFAYYPYNATAPTVDETKDKADEFFKDKITNWNPVKDQNAEEVLLRQDLQVGEGVIDNDASTLTFNMAHSMGLAVLNLDNKDIPKTRRFVNNNYTYYYPSYEHRVTTEPTMGKDYTDDNTTQKVRASNAFSGNIPCSSKITAYRYFQIVKPSTDVSFKASDESGNPRSAWGTHTSYTFNVAQNAAMTKSITTDADFYYLARLFSFKGSTESFTVPVDGTYTLECWGAGEKQGGKSKGDYQAQKNTILYICVGGQGTPGDRENIGKGGYNGGGNGGTAVINDKGQPLKRGDGGCGATHICLEDGVLSKLETAYKNNRLLMVAGGQGGAQYPTGSGPFGGGTEGGRPTNKAGQTFDAATQTDGFAFGQGQTGRNGTKKTQNGGEGNGGGGGGLYGGYSPQEPGNKTNSPGGGGSGYVNAKLLVDCETIAGNQSFLSPSGVSETGHAGHGAALISWLP